ncbi:hypothetical protein EDI_133850 [Entamoeba dispar SAW760]|uniref:Uncharacterized protein n=1 Tax=Entamoeba dispar (strain ATCC PRA-260 / SAW760) TaxID=370354 RepID=B0EKE2_ENTDS|nr:uncharacterized protein EDI_133850 [Entamoeba dispar SAW760]EDR24980.1 hypothetical protein EDI_133850 [Entamoeba dispar SAW760]|eukprot:EDR24980.1 hypothetical protein EDI_133850 [Entamoeba dispar SAW760]
MTLDFDIFLSVLTFTTQKHPFQLRKGVQPMLNTQLKRHKQHIEELAEHFGKQITQYVCEVTDNKKHDKVTGKNYKLSIVKQFLKEVT